MKQDFKVYLRLLSYLKSFKWAIILVIVGFAINAGTEVSVARLLKYIIESIQNHNQQTPRWGFCHPIPVTVFYAVWQSLA